MKPRLCVLAVVVVFVGASLATARTWTDTKGRTIEATFVRLHEGNVIMLKGTKPVSVALSELSPEDQEYIRHQAAAKPKEKDAKEDPVKPLEEKPSPRKGRSNADAPERTWTDIRGNRMQAKFGGVSGDSVILLVKGKTRIFPLSGFSQADQDYIRKELAERGQANLLPGGAMPPGGAMLPGGAMPPGVGMPALPPTRRTPPIPRSHRPSVAGRPGLSPPDMSRHSIPRPSSPSFPRTTLPREETPRPSIAQSRPSMPSMRTTPSIPRPSMPTTPSYQTPIRPPSMPQMSNQYTKVCCSCGKPVPDSSKAGGTCPHCGAYWSVEKDETGRTVSTAYRGAAYSGVACVVGLIIWLVTRVLRG